MAFQLKLVGHIGRKDARLTPRSKLGATAWIRLGSGIAVRKCSVIDVSRTGVQLQTISAVYVPEEFHLMMARGKHPGRRCRVVWRKGRKLGAKFV